MIEVANLTTQDIDQPVLKKMAQLVLKGEKKDKENLSIAIIGKARMRKLNKKYRAKNRVTDVLAFPGKELGKQKFITPLKMSRNLGEVVICLREVKKNARRLNSSFEKELEACLIHGILHLLGYDHTKSEQQAETMRQKEKHYSTLAEMSKFGN